MHPSDVLFDMSFRNLIGFKFDFFFFLVLKLFASSWNLNPSARIQTHEVRTQTSQNFAWNLNPHGWDSNSAKTQGLPTEVTELLSEPNEAQVLDVSLKEEFSWQTASFYGLGNFIG